MGLSIVFSLGWLNNSFHITEAIVIRYFVLALWLVTLQFGFFYVIRM